MKNKHDFTPPAKPCMWEIDWFDDLIGPTCMVVGPCKTAYDAWRISGLKGAFGDYEYEPSGSEE